MSSAGGSCDNAGPRGKAAPVATKTGRIGLNRSALGTAILGIALAVASPTAADAKGKVFGDGVKLKTPMPIEALKASPSVWVGKTVRADGVVTGVCEKAGCWMELSDEKTGKGVRFKVEDGVIVFPLTARGRKASAEGVFEEVVVTPEEQKKHEREYKTSDADAGHAGHAAHPKGPSYRIRATGAIIY